MKYKWDKTYLYWGITAFCVIGAFALLSSLLLNIGSVSKFLNDVWDVLTPVVIGFVFAYILAPIMNFFEKNCFRRLFTFIFDKIDKAQGEKPISPKTRNLKIKKLSRIFGVTTTMISALLVVGGLVWAVIPQLVVSFEKILYVDYISIIRSWVNYLFSDYPDIHMTAMEYVDNFSVTFAEFANTRDLIPEILNLLTNVSEGIANTISAFFDFTIGLIICVYFLYGKELFAAQCKKVLYGLFKVKVANIILNNMRQIHKKFGGFVVGKLIDTFIIGVIFFVIFTIIGTPYTILISIVLAVTNIIPIFGPFIGAVPCGLLILFNDPIHCLYFAIVVLVVQQFEGNVLCPKILGDNTGLSSFWVIFSMLVGEYFLGFAGLIIGIPIFAVIYTLFKDYINSRLKHKEIPVDTNYYRELAYFDTDSGEAVSVKTMQENEGVKRQYFNGKKRKKKESIITNTIKGIKDKKGRK